MHLARDPGKATAQQRLYARTLMQRLELSTHRFGFQHRSAFKAAGLGEPPLDKDVDAHLCALSKAEASALIKVLRARLED